MDTDGQISFLLNSLFWWWWWSIDGSLVVHSEAPCVCPAALQSNPRILHNLFPSKNEKCEHNRFFAFRRLHNRVLALQLVFPRCPG
jgi:hypothetical protein